MKAPPMMKTKKEAMLITMSSVSTNLLESLREKDLNLRLRIVYSFCSISISVKVSMISPSWMSLKLTSESPHSKPEATSFTSSL